MAKNVYYDRDGNKAEEIRKARGNPNRNNHTKRKNANYGGYDAAPRVKESAPARRRLQLTRAQKIAFGVDIAVLAVLLILQFLVFPDNSLLPAISTMVLGISCGMLYFFRRSAPLEHTTSYKILQAALCIIAVGYVVLGAMGILTFIRTPG